MSAERAKPLVHHELCFGCGRANLFGLLGELERADAGRVTGRCFVKQDHQGPSRGIAHPGIVAAALTEALSLARDDDQQPRGLRALEVRFEGPVPVGTFLELDACAEIATASVDGRPVASARATWG